MEYVIENLKGFKKWMFRKNLEIRSLILLEGESDIERVGKFTTNKMLYFPNYIFEKNIPDELSLKDTYQLGICHFGRITSQKS